MCVNTFKRCVEFSTLDKELKEKVISKLIASNCYEPNSPPKHVIVFWEPTTVSLQNKTVYVHRSRDFLKTPWAKTLGYSKPDKNEKSQMTKIQRHVRKNTLGGIFTREKCYLIVVLIQENSGQRLIRALRLN